MVSCCLPHGVVVNVQFWSSPGPTGGFCQKKNLSMCLSLGLIVNVVLFCKIHDLDVQCASLVKCFALLD